MALQFKHMPLVDSGACTSCMSESFYLRTCLKGSYPMSKSNVKALKGVSGVNIQILGEATLPLQIQDQTFIHTFQILKHSNVHVILGVDFLQQHKARLNWDTCKFEVVCSITDESSTHSPQSAIAKLSCNVLIKPGQRVLAPVKTKSKFIGSGIVDPSCSFARKHSLLSARCLVDFKDNKSCIEIFNPTDTSIFCYKNSIVGTVTSISDCEILDDIDENTHTIYDTRRCN